MENFAHFIICHRIHLDKYRACGITGQGNQIKTSSRKSKGGSGRIAVGLTVDSNFFRAAQRIGGAIRIGLVIAIDIVGVVSGKAELAGAILLLGNAVLGLSNLFPFAAIVIERDKAVLVVDVGSRNYGNSRVIILLIIRQISLCRIGELLRTIHLHILGRIAHLSPINGGSAIGAGVLSGESGCRRFCTLCGRYAAHCGQPHHSSAFAEDVVRQHTDINRQAEIDDDRVRYTADLVLDCEPDDGMGIIITGILCA